MKHKVDGHQNLYKDTNSGVINNREGSDRARYRMAKQQAMRSLDTEYEISNLRREMDEIKSLLHQILKK
jgi:hypothetical protein